MREILKVLAFIIALFAFCTVVFRGIDYIFPTPERVTVCVINDNKIIVDCMGVSEWLLRDQK